MKLRTKRWSLRLVTLAILTGTGLIVALGLSDSGTDRERMSVDLSSSAKAGKPEPSSDTQLDFSPVWEKRLQQVLFDPPPPPPIVEVKPPPPPLQEKLLGTMIDDDNSQAIIQDAQQNVHFRRVGQSISPGSADALIEKILPSSIEVRRGDDLTTLQME
ncbi:hypothetical protein [Aeoliella sp. SH292]|uniref:hypothetical protein n=1 Tax=Aeoliella sp. SH292 TaxID=3454464 RepID=UPI003F9A05FB